jgi:tetratricopeptide (TPR) repeat protein
VRRIRRAARTWLTVAAVGGVLLPRVAQAQATTPGSRVLVMPFVADVEAGAPGGAGAALWLGEAASVVITEGLVAQGVAALAREDREAAFDRLNLTMSGALTRATTLRVGELIGASEVVFGEVRLGTRLQVRARLVRIDAAREVPAVIEEGPLEDIFGVFGRAAARLTSQTGRFRPTSRPIPPMPLEAFESYVKGLVAATPAAEQRFLEGAIRLAPDDPRILLALWRVHATQGHHDRALAVASAVAAESPAYRQARFAVALSLIDLRRLDGAYQALSALAAAERSAPVANALGVVQLRRGVSSGAASAATYFRRAVDEDPDNPDYLFNLGYAHATAGNLDEALTWLREVVRVDVADADAHLVMSALLSTAGRAPEAQRELDLARLLGAEPGPAVGVTRLPADLERVPTSAHLSAGFRVRALAAGPAQRDQRETAAFHLANGRALVEKQRDREAADELRRAIYLAPYEDEPHVLLGQIYVRAGRVREAIDELTVAVWCRDSVRARIALAEALVLAGERAQARSHVDRALALDPRSVDAQALARRLAD